MIARICANFEVWDVWIVSQKAVSAAQASKKKPLQPHVAHNGAQAWPFDLRYWRHAHALATTEGQAVLDKMQVVTAFPFHDLSRLPSCIMSARGGGRRIGRPHRAPSWGLTV